MRPLILDGHCRRRLESVAKSDVRLKTEVDHGTTYKVYPLGSEIEHWQSHTRSVRQFYLRAE